MVSVRLLFQLTHSAHYSYLMWLTGGAAFVIEMYFRIGLDFRCKSHKRLIYTHTKRGLIKSWPYSRGTSRPALKDKTMYLKKKNVIKLVFTAGLLYHADWKDNVRLAICRGGCTLDYSVVEVIYIIPNEVTSQFLISRVVHEYVFFVIVVCLLLLIVNELVSFL